MRRFYSVIVDMLPSFTRVCIPIVFFIVVLAVFGQRTTLWWDLPVIESLELLRHVYKIPLELFQHNLAEFTDMLEMESFLHTPVRSLSLGQRMRADIAAALLHNPDTKWQRLAEESYRKALEIDPWNADYLVCLGRLYRKQGLTTRARRHFEMALEILPAHIQAREELSSLS